MVELGFRARLSDKVSLDLELYHQEITDVIAPVYDGSGTPPLVAVQNVPTAAKQNGVTLSMNIVPSTAFQFKPFVTLQSTQTTDIVNSTFGGLALITEYAADPSVVSFTAKDDHESTPSVYGGFYANYSTGKFNIGLSSYFMSSYFIYHIDQTTDALTGQVPPVNNLGAIDGKMLFSAKANYKVNSQLNVFFNARNLFNANGREFYGVDENGGLYLVGASFNWQ